LQDRDNQIQSARDICKLVAHHKSSCGLALHDASFKTRILYEYMIS
jgi:hypothetical protein